MSAATHGSTRLKALVDVNTREAQADVEPVERLLMLTTVGVITMVEALICVEFLRFDFFIRNRGKNNVGQPSLASSLTCERLENRRLLSAVPQPGGAWSLAGYNEQGNGLDPVGSTVKLGDAAFVSTFQSQSGFTTALTGDVMGNGKLDLIFGDGSDVEVVGPGDNVISSLPGVGNLNILADVTGTGVPDILVSNNVSGTVEVDAYTAAGTLVQKYSLAAASDSVMTAVDVVDLANNGQFDLVARVGSAFSESVRGVAIFDAASGALIGTYDIGPQASYASLGDLTGDGTTDIVLSSIGVDNGKVGANGSSDSSSYVFAVDDSANTLWTAGPFDSGGFYDGYALLADLYNNGTLDVIATPSSHGYGPFEGSVGSVMLLNPTDGSTVAGFDRDMGAPVHVEGVGNLDPAGGTQILIVREDASVGHYFVDALESTAGLPTWKSFDAGTSMPTICAVNDIDGDGSEDVIVAAGNTLYVLNNDLTVKWQWQRPDDSQLPINGAIVSHLDGTGANEIIVSSGDSETDDRIDVLNSPTLFPRQIGNLDRSFGVQGVVNKSLGFGNSTGVAQDSNQSILIGVIGTSPNESFGVTRDNPDGTTDTTFGGGVVSTSFNGTDDVPAAVYVLPDGQVLVAGTATTFSNGTASGSEFAVAEYNTDGSLDTSFGGGTGEVMVSFSTTPGTLSNDVLNAMAVGAGGVIYLGGSSDASGSGDTEFALVALNADGSVDTGFGHAGTVLLSFGNGDDVINGVALQSNGDIVAAGSAAKGGASEIALARFDPGGAVDTRFGARGLVVTNVRGVDDSAASVVIQPKGQIVVGGSSATDTGGVPTSDFVVARYTSAGKIDKTFGGGPIITGFGQPSAVTQLILQSNGEIIASGKVAPELADAASNALDIAVVRYTTRGVLDSVFDGTGKTVINLSSGTVTSSSLHTGVFSAASIEPLDAGGLGTTFDQFVSSKQGVVANVTGGEILDVGSSGANTIEAKIITAGLDLASKILSSLPAAVLGGAKGTVTISITASGTSAAIASVTVEVQLATDAQGDEVVNVVSYPERLNLPVGHSHDYRIPFAYPAQATAGNFYLLATVQVPAALHLLNPDDTVASASPVNVAPAFVSLSGSSLSAGSAFAPAKTAAVIFTITNDGNVPAKGASTVDLILSADQIASDGITADQAKIAIGLSPDKSRVYRVSFKLPTTVTAGTYYLIAVIDPAESLGAIDKTSSTIVDPTQLVVG